MNKNANAITAMPMQNQGIHEHDISLHPERFTLTVKNQIIGTMFFYFGEQGRMPMDEFDAAMRSVFQKYGIKLREFKPVSKGQIGEVMNSIEQPDLIIIFSAEDMASFQSYLNDQETLRLGKIRQLGMRKIIAIIGNATDADELLSRASTTALHSLALVNFKDEMGLINLVEFNRQGVQSGLFRRYGIHPEQFILPLKVIELKGEAGFETPELIVQFGMDDPSKLKDYINDPEYLRLAPLRDAHLKNYRFFTCT